MKRNRICSMAFGRRKAMLQDVLFTDAAVWTKLRHRPFLISHQLVTILCSCCNCSWRDGTVKKISIFYCDLAGKLGGDWIPLILLRKPEAVDWELDIHSQLGFRFYLVPLLILQSRLLGLPVPFFAIFRNQGLRACFCGTFGVFFNILSLLLYWCSPLVTFDLAVEMQQGPTAILMGEAIAENPGTSKVTGWHR